MGFILADGGNQLIIEVILINYGVGIDKETEKKTITSGFNGTNDRHRSFRFFTDLSVFAIDGSRSCD